MKSMITITIRALSIAISAVLSILGCSHERLVIPSLPNKEVLFHINIPGKSAPDTRALGDVAENEVKTIEMLLFNPVTKEVASNPVFANEITSDPDGDGTFRKKSFSVRLPQGTFDVMVFANARAAFGGMTIGTGDPQEATLARLKALMPANGWASDPVASPHGYLIPMWGMKENVSVGEGAAISGIYLHRMLSRIDIDVTGSAGETGDFTIKDIKLYNVQKEGRISPALTNWNPHGQVNGTVTAGLALAPSVVPDCGVYGSISYAHRIAPDQKSCLGEIYLFEAPKAAVHADQKAPYLTVKGAFNGVEGWYRIDLADYATMNYLPLLRNHLYKILINRVTGTGFPNEEDAKKNRGDNIVVDICLWNEYDLGGTVFDGQRFLSINPQDVHFSEDSHISQTLTIKTDIDSEITLSNIKVSGSATHPNEVIGWIQNLSLSAKSVANDKNVYTLTYSVAANNGDARTGYVYVTLGRLTNVVRMAQDEGGNTITVPDYLMLGPEEQRPVTHQRLNVTCLKRNGDPDPNATWSLTVPQEIEWLKISLTNNYQSAGKGVSGTGSTGVYLFVDSNILGSDAREATVILSSNGTTLGYCVVRQSKDTPPSQAVSDRASCVGAFWRHDQIGERIVQINMGEHSGGWMASVSFYDEKWSPENGDGVLLALSGTSDLNVGIQGVEPDDAENHPLTGFGYTSIISGIASANQDITFRIGLEKRFTAFNANTNPARYAVIELWYADYTRMQKIYLRQGEGDDYVMTKGQPDNRPYAVKFSPFNLTAKDMMDTDPKYVHIASNRSNAAFTAYPTQIGAFFQWANTTGSSAFRNAWDPSTTSLSGLWDSGNTTSFSSSDHETCPTGYRRPNDNSSNFSNSEMRQSLWANYVQSSSQGGNHENYLYGYYADGFYDRRYIDRSDSFSNGVVAKGTNKVASGGGLFYNPQTNASLFLPVGGYRSYASGALTNIGYYGYYLTSLNTQYYGCVLSIADSGFLVITEQVMRAQGSNIRCVKN